MKILIYPFAFILCWCYWFRGHVASKFMLLQDEGWWFDFWFTSYQFYMLLSSDIQESIGGKGCTWPWREAVIFKDDK